MTDLLLVFRPRGLRSANRLASLTLYSAALSLGSDLLIVDLPEGMESLLRWPHASPSSVLEAAVELGWLPQSSSTLRVLEPLIEGLLNVNRDLKVEIKCYVDSSLFKEDVKLQSEVPRLLLRASIKGLSPSDLEEWLDLIHRRNELGRASLNTVTEKVAELAVKRRRPICLSGLEAWELAKRLRSSGIKVRLESVGLPYLRSPMEVMHLLASRGQLSLEELRSLIKEQLDYVKRYVMRYGDLDEAHIKWTRDKAPWLAGFSSISELVGESFF
ncbi:MAG: hypothetical protein DRJ97_00655 [Thermoprotei archaeon]|nr:MAG: hypothetical protein DRJ97_00655 [Thermoprotei archaeon]